MNLEVLLQRSKEIDAAIANMATQLNALHGHKAEADYWISQLQSENETKVDSNEDNPVE